MTDADLKLMDKKSLRLMIKDLLAQRDSLLNQIGGLNSEVERLNGERKIQNERLETLTSDLKHEQSKNQVLASNNSRLGEELRLAQANRTVSAILQGVVSDIKNKFKKVSK